MPSGSGCMALAYNLGNFMRTLALPDSVEQWSLTTLREKLIKIGAKISATAAKFIFQMAEVAIRETLRRHPAPHRPGQTDAHSGMNDGIRSSHADDGPVHLVCSRRVVCPATPPIVPPSDESDYRRPQDASKLQCERFRVTINSSIRCPNGILG